VVDMTSHNPEEFAASVIGNDLEKAPAEAVIW
jgi:hypothetical protein